MRRWVKISFVASAMSISAFAFVALPRANETPTIRTHTVVIESMKFTPMEVHINPGDSVIFQNKDLVPHTATAKEPKAFDSGLIKAGESWTVQFVGHPQTIRYACVYHPTMEGRVVVAQR